MSDFQYMRDNGLCDEEGIAYGDREDISDYNVGLIYDSFTALEGDILPVNGFDVFIDSYYLGVEISTGLVCGIWFTDEGNTLKVLNHNITEAEHHQREKEQNEGKK